MKAYLLAWGRALLVSLVTVAILRALFYLLDWNLTVWMLAAWMLLLIELREGEKT